MSPLIDPSKITHCRGFCLGFYLTTDRTIKHDPFAPQIDWVAVSLVVLVGVAEGNTSSLDGLATIAGNNRRQGEFINQLQSRTKHRHIREWACHTRKKHDDSRS